MAIQKRPGRKIPLDGGDRKNSASGRAIKNATTSSPPTAKKNDDESDGKSTRNLTTGGQEDLSIMNMAPALVVSILVSVGSYYSSGSLEMAEDAAVATARTFLQLSLLAAILSSLFRYVDDKTKATSTGATPKKCTAFKFLKDQSAPLFVLAYVLFFMLPIAAWEASSRSKLTLRVGDSSLPYSNIVFFIIAISLFAAVSAMGAIAIFAIVKPIPRYSPRHVIPISGMLFNNALTSKQRATIELMISFGVDTWTATRPTFQSVLASSLKPQINAMNVIGLVAIPGMMTGQVLGGASPTRAARYQMMIMVLILGANFISVAMTAELVIWNAFDEMGVLRDDWIVDNDSLRVSQVFSSLATPGGLSRSEGSVHSSTVESSDVITVELSAEDQGRSSQTTKSVGLDEQPFFQVKLDGLFSGGRRHMRANFSIPSSSIAVLRGASGIGKTSLLKTIAACCNSGLDPSAESFVASLTGKDHALLHPSSANEWRKNVLYLPQSGASLLQGTPSHLLHVLSSKRSARVGMQDEESLISHTVKYMEAWGISSARSRLEQHWKTFSGGESQRILLAIALATKPRVLLCDEPTSALDMESKLAVEKSLKESVGGQGSAILVVTHEEDQVNRLGATLFSLGEAAQ